MKVQAELTFTIEAEPLQFKDVHELISRNVYLWLDYRGAFEADSPWITQQRLSNGQIDPATSFMEIWTKNNDDISPSPPLNTDDNWLETYKILRQKNYSVEYHPETKMLRFVWVQTRENLTDNKILASVLAAVAEYGQAFPNLPVRLS